MAPISTLTYPLHPTMHKSLAPSACYFFDHLGHFNSLGDGKETHLKQQGVCQNAQDFQPSGRPMPHHFASSLLQEEMPASFCTFIEVENGLFKSLGYQAGNPHSLFSCASVRESDDGFILWQILPSFCLAWSHLQSPLCLPAYYK